jgi:hypothetical protein
MPDTHGGYVNVAARSAALAERVSNWLALLALIALGVVWPGSQASPPPRSAQLGAQHTAETSPLPP